MAKSPTMKQVRRAVRRELHRYLDAMLKCAVKAPNGETITMLDDLCVRSVFGFGFAVGISVTPLEPPPAARSGLRLHGPTCREPACPGCADLAPKLEVVR